MSDDLESLRQDTLASLKQAKDLREWDAIRVSVLGRAGKLTTLLKRLGVMKPEERKKQGVLLNRLRDELTVAIEKRGSTIREEAIEQNLAEDNVDVTLPCGPDLLGVIHPISRTIAEVQTILGTMGFDIYPGPDVETEWYNFTALNTPSSHPARADHDTFYLPPESDKTALLRTQTSASGQIRAMLSQKPPMRIFSVGRTYRADHDTTHSPMFHQCEGMVIEKNVTLGHLKGCLTDFLRTFFGISSLPIRFRASYFPFTEPSLEVDLGWNSRTGEIGKGGGDWLEILGAGMTHPRVYANCGIDPAEWQGFAFGVGIERLTMLKEGIPDLRSFFDSDIRWLRHFGFNPLSPVILRERL